MEMETRAREAIEIGQDLTPPLPPISFALHDSFLPSACSACFGATSFSTRRAISGTSTATAKTSRFVVYCSDKCASADSSLHFSSAEYELFLHLRRHPSSWPHGDTTDLRASLRLLRHLELLNLLPTLSLPLPVRIAGLMTNCERLTSIKDDESLARVKDGARAMAMARAMRDGKELDGDCKLEEALMCIVLTNAVEVQRRSLLGIAVYDGRFSWINHSCSPNACYMFNFCSEDLESSDRVNLRIQPANRGVRSRDNSAYSMYELAEGCSSYGPRLVVRSIKMMRRGDEVTVTYTDLKKPRVLRKSSLWWKYQFSCSCIRCIAVPLPYVDHALQETFDVQPCALHLRHTSSADKNRIVEEITDYFDSVMSQFMSESIITESYCEKIENLLTGKLQSEEINHNEPYNMAIRLAPINHLSLSSYTFLSFGYDILSWDVRNPSITFNMRKISTAYRLLLAGATHHLFISDPSLITSAANFWIDAGSSLIGFARYAFLPSLINDSSPTNYHFLSSLVCDSCLLMGIFEANFSSVPKFEELNKVSEHFLKCMTRITPKVWNYLSRCCVYLAEIEDPIDFSWLESMRTSNVWEITTEMLLSGLYSTQRFDGDGTENSKDGVMNELTNDLLLLGAHSMIYGWYLSCVCYGQDSSVAIDAMERLYG